MVICVTFRAETCILHIKGLSDSLAQAEIEAKIVRDRSDLISFSSMCTYTIISLHLDDILVPQRNKC